MEMLKVCEKIKVDKIREISQYEEYEEYTKLTEYLEKNIGKLVGKL